MFRPFRRKRRPDDGRYQPKDEKAWRRLIRAARYAVRAPLASGEPLRKAADACGSAVPPPGHARRDSDFLGLMSMGRMWWRLGTDGRLHHAERLNTLADACDTALGGGKSPFAPPPRRDLFG